jgi:hypothetical protein
MYDYFVGLSTITALLSLILAKFLPKLLKFTQVNDSALNIAQGLMIAYGIIFGVISPIIVLAAYALHYVMPF